MKDLQVGFCSGHEGGELLVVLTSNVLESQDGSGLRVNEGSETGLALDNDIWDPHLAAKGRKEDNEFDRVNIISDNDEVGLLGFDEGDAVIKTVFDEQRLLGLLNGHPERFNERQA